MLMNLADIPLASWLHINFPTFAFRCCLQKEEALSQHSGVVGAAGKVGERVDEHHVRIGDPLGYDGGKLRAIVVTLFGLRGTRNAHMAPINRVDHVR